MEGLWESIDGVVEGAMDGIREGMLVAGRGLSAGANAGGKVDAEPSGKTPSRR